jgi:hypothetical protein
MSTKHIGFLNQHKAAEISKALSILSSVDKNDIATRILEHEQITDFSNILDVVEEDLTIYCTKTGQPLQSYSWKQYCQLCRIHGKERAWNIFKAQSFHRVADHWLYTDDKALETLSKLDPYGYFVYAAAFILMPLQRQIKKNLRSKEAQFLEDLYEVEQRKACWNNIQSVALSRIVEANEIMRRYLGLFRTEKCYSLTVFKLNPVTLNQLGSSDKPVCVWIKNIEDSIERILAKEIKRGRINRIPTYADVVSLKVFYEGHTAFRRQKMLGNISELDEVLVHLEGFCKDRFADGKTAVTTFAETIPAEKWKKGVKLQTANSSGKKFQLKKAESNKPVPNLSQLLNKV